MVGLEGWTRHYAPPTAARNIGSFCTVPDRHDLGH
jgi:hypothetical protein